MTGLWYPYTPMGKHGPLRPPVAIQGAEGPYLIDTKGRKIIDGVGSWWVANLGHRHPCLVATLQRQAERLAHVALAGLTHRPAEALAEALLEVAPPGIGRVFYTDDGSTAVEVALRIALQYHQLRGDGRRTRFVALKHAFHGETVACASLSDMPEFHHAMSPIAFKVLRIPSPADGEQHAISALESLLQEQGERVAALVMEPLVQGAGGMRMHAPSFLRRARALTERFGVLLILDEVFTGYGRTGSFWACDQAGIAPDILCTAKGFTGGMLPMAATLVREEVFEPFATEGEKGPLRYGHSFCGNPLGCAVALEVLNIYREEKVLENLPAREGILQKGIEALAGIKGVKNPRRTGMIAAVDLPPVKRAGYEDPAGWRVYDAALRRGAYLRPLGNVLYFVPPLNIDCSVLEELMAIALDSVEEALGR